MKKTLKKSVSVILAVAMIFSSAYIGLTELDFSGLLAIEAKAASSGTCGDNLTWSLDEGLLTISGTGAMDSYSLTSLSPFSSLNEVKEVVIAEGVTTIGGYAFVNCVNLTTISIPDGITSIGDLSFSNCKNLLSVAIPADVTNIGNQVFYDCDSLKYVFYAGSESEWGDITIGEENSVLTNAKFHYNSTGHNYVDGKCTVCDLQVSLGFSLNEDERSYSLIDCEMTDVGKVVIPDEYDGLPVMDLGTGAFFDCKNLMEVEIPDGVTYIAASAFQDCTKLTSIKIPHGVKSLNIWTFGNCTSLKSIIIPDGITSIGNYAFYGCTSLASVIICDGVTSIGESAFNGCTRLTSVTFGDSVTSLGVSAFENCISLIELKIPDGVTNIGDFAFWGCEKLTSVTIPNSVTNIDDRTFFMCTSLASIIVPDSVTSIGVWAFPYSTKIYCFENSGAHDYAVNYSRDYALIKLYSKNENVNIDYEKKIVFSSVDICTDVSDIVSTAEEFALDVTESFSAGTTKLYGTGSKVNITNNGTVLDEYTVITVSDLNGDSVCDVLDAAVAQLYSAGLHEPTENEIYAANGCISDGIDETSYQNVVNTCLAS